MKSRLLAVLLLASTAAVAGDWEFDRVVKAVEQHYGVKRTHIPLMGFANFVVKVARPYGVAGFKLAVFENLEWSGRDDYRDLDRFMAGLYTSGLHPLVRVHSRHDGEATYILTGECGRTTKMLIATFERDEAVVIQVKADLQTLLRAIDNPHDAGHMFRGTD